MDLQLYNTLTRRKEPFRPLDPANVRMYVCGPTVYDFAHIGNARPAIVFDVLFRLLRHLYGPEHVTYVRNITDVDDKINERALRDYGAEIAAGELTLNEAIRKVTEPTYEQYQRDVTALGCLPPTHQPRATEFVLPRVDRKADMVTLIQSLLDREHAYLAEGGEGREVLFDVVSMPDYGELSKRMLEDQQAGARVAVEAHKKHPADFVLWKESGNREPGWDGQFVPNPSAGYHAEFDISRENARALGLNSRRVTIHGRPGWHIECSAMSAAYLGEVFDIHGGGLDLIFPHHENEIAQSRCAHGSEMMAQVWMHNGFLQVEGEKMSKSLGNFVTIRELLEDWPGDVLRLQTLMTHYRQPIDWTERQSQLAANELEEWAHALMGYWSFRNTNEPHEVLEALSDDLNSPKAISALRELFQKAKGGGMNEVLRFAANCRFLGFRHLDKPGYFRLGVSGLNVEPQRLFDFERAIKSFRAALANDAPDDMKHGILAPIRDKGLGIDIGRSGDITIVRGDKVEINQQIEQLIAARNAARAAKNFAEADRIRDELAAMGVVLKDFKDPQTGEQKTTWEIAR